MSETEQAQTINILQVLPEDWRNHHVQLFIYKMFIADEEEITKSLLKIAGDNYIFMFIRGQLNELPTINLDGFDSKGIKISLGKKSLPLDTYLYIFVLGDMNTSAATLTRDFIVGVLTATIGKNVSYCLVAETELNYMETGAVQFSVATPAMENPLFRGPASVNAKAVEETAKILKKIESLEEKVKTRFETAIRWFNSANQIHGSDAVLKYWVAIETLIMPNTVNIKPIKQALGAIYSLSESEANIKFKIGRIHNLRSEIVHNGFNKPIKSSFLSYIEFLFIDLLFYLLGVEGSRYAEAELKKSNGDIEVVLQSLKD